MLPHSLRNTLEFVIILLIAAATLSIQRNGWLSPGSMKLLVIALCELKAAFFVGEQMVQLRDATRVNLAYHKFMRMILVNMLQITLSFALDYYCLLSVDRQSLSVNPQDSKNIQGGTQDNGTFETSGSAIVWPQTIFGDGGLSGFDAADKSFRFHTYFVQQVDVNFQRDRKSTRLNSSHRH